MTKFQIIFTKGTGLDSGQYSITISNPANNITVNQLTEFQTALSNAYSDTFVLKTAKYIESSDTYVYPVS